MDLYLDVDSRSFVTSLTSSIPLEGLTFKRRDTAKLNLYFVQNGENLNLGAINSGGSGATLSSLSVGLKNDGDYASAFLAFADTSLFYTSTFYNFYTFSLSLNTSELDSIFTADSEISSISTMLEFQWTQCDGAVFSSTTLPVLVQNDVIRGDEGPLSQANPAYPSALALATQKAALDRLTMMIQQIVGSAGITTAVIYPLITGLTGGGATNLDGIVTAGGVITANYVVQVFLNKSGSTFFRFEPTALTTSQLPGIVLPADWNASTNPNAWYQQ